jgi:hypothetical protein
MRQFGPSAAEAAGNPSATPLQRSAALCLLSRAESFSLQQQPQQQQALPGAFQQAAAAARRLHGNFGMSMREGVDRRRSDGSAPFSPSTQSVSPAQQRMPLSQASRLSRRALSIAGGPTAGDPAGLFR